MESPPAIWRGRSGRDLENRSWSRAFAVHGRTLGEGQRGAGTLWVDTFRGLVCLPKGSRQFQRPASLASGWAPFAESRDGILWRLDWTPPAAPRVVFAGSGRVLREFDLQARVYKMLADQQGSLWVGTAGRGINRTQYPERVDAKNIKGSERHRGHLPAKERTERRPRHGSSGGPGRRHMGRDERGTGPLPAESTHFRQVSRGCAWF